MSPDGPRRLALFEGIEGPLVKIFSPKFKGVEGILKNLVLWNVSLFGGRDDARLRDRLTALKKTSADQLPRTYAEFAEGE